MRIGNVDIKTNVALGPMAGVTDLPFRLLCKEQGCGLLYTEMVSAKAVLYNNKNTEELLKTDKKESPIAVGKSRGAARFPSAVWLGSGGPFGYRRQTGGGALRTFLLKYGMSSS